MYELHGSVRVKNFLRSTLTTTQKTFDQICEDIRLDKAKGVYPQRSDAVEGGTEEQESDGQDS